MIEGVPFLRWLLDFLKSKARLLEIRMNHFYGYSSDSSESDDSSDSSDTVERSPLAGGYVGSDAEENLDDSFLSPVAVSEASALEAPSSCR